MLFRDRRVHPFAIVILAFISRGRRSRRRREIRGGDAHVLLADEFVCFVERYFRLREHVNYERDSVCVAELLILNDCCAFLVAWFKIMVDFVEQTQII